MLGRQPQVSCVQCSALSPTCTHALIHSISRLVAEVGLHVRGLVSEADTCLHGQTLAWPNTCMAKAEHALFTTVERCSTQFHATRDRHVPPGACVGVESGRRWPSFSQVMEKR